MQVLKFMNSHSDWEELLTGALATQKEYAEKALKYPFSDYLFSKRKNVTLTPTDYLKSISIDNVLKLMNWED